jgi:hypothetical protein
VPLSVEGPPADPAGPPRDWRAVAATGALGLAALALAVVLLRRALPPLRRAAGAARARWLASERWAWGRLRRAVRARDRAELQRGLDLWARRLDGPDPRRDPELLAALAALGAARHAAPARGGEDAAWRAVAAVLPRLRRAARAPAARGALPPLNPGG